MKFIATTHFLDRLQVFLLRKKDFYDSCSRDIIDQFQNPKIEEISQWGSPIYKNDSATLIKVRIRNRRANLSKSNGWRLLFVVDRKHDLICFLELYPKTGSLGQETINKEHYLKYMEEYVNILDSGLSEVNSTERIEDAFLHSKFSIDESQ